MTARNCLQCGREGSFSVRTQTTNPENDTEMERTCARSEYPENTCSKMEVDTSGSVDSSPAPAMRYRQRLEKSSGGEAVLMEWSPTMDLLAVALADHSVRQFVLSVHFSFHTIHCLSLGHLKSTVMATCVDGWAEQCSCHSHGLETRWTRLSTTKWLTRTIF